MSEATTKSAQKTAETHLRQAESHLAQTRSALSAGTSGIIAMALNEKDGMYDIDDAEDILESIMNKYGGFSITIPPIKFGIKNTDLKKFVPFSPFVSSKANKKAKVFTVIIETIVNKDVNPSERTKSLSKVKAFI